MHVNRPPLDSLPVRRPPEFEEGEDKLLESHRESVSRASIAGPRRGKRKDETGDQTETGSSRTAVFWMEMCEKRTSKKNEVRKEHEEERKMKEHGDGVCGRHVDAAAR